MRSSEKKKKGHISKEVCFPLGENKVKGLNAFQLANLQKEKKQSGEDYTNYHLLAP